MAVVFARETALGLNCLDVLKRSSQQELIVNSISKLSDEIEARKDELVDKLFLTIQQEDNIAMRNKLLNIKRDLYNDRNILKHLILPLDDCIKQKMKELDEALQQRNLQFETGRLCYAEDLQRAIEELEELAHHPKVFNGILFSAKQLFQTLIDKELCLLKKNKGSAINQVCKYVLRSITKTTPFSSFNSTYWITDSVGSNEKRKRELSAIQISNLIYLLVKRVICWDISLLRQFGIELNPSIIKKGKNYEYFISIDNRDQLKRLKCSQVIAYLKKVFNERQACTLECLSELMTEKFDTDSNNAIQYLHTMVREGILLPVLPITAFTEGWPEKLISFLDINKENFACNQIIIPLCEFLLKLDTIRAQLEQVSDVVVRHEVLKEAEQSYLLFITSLKKIYQDFPFFKEFENLDYTDLFYEDVISYNKTDNTFAEDDIEKLKNLVFVRSIEIHKQAFSIITDKHHAKRIPFLDFYTDYCKHIAEIKKEFERLLSEAVTGVLTKNIGEIEKSRNTCVISFPAKSVNDDLVTNLSAGVFFQKVNNSDQLIINNITDGCGKNISRFLPYSSSEIVDKEKAHAYKKFPDAIVADIKDCSIHNVNKIPPLTDYVIIIPGAESDNRFSKKIPMSELVVEAESLSLMWRDKKVVPFHYSMEGIRRKSAVFQLLVGFNSILPIHQLFIASLEEIWRTRLCEGRRGVLLLPRLQLNEHLIINRKKWFVQKSIFDKMCFQRFGASSFFHSYIKLILWQKENQIPDEVFVKYSKIRTQGSNRHKPQYLNFKSPLLVESLCFDLKKADDIIEIEEALPNSHNAIIDEAGEKKTREYLVNL